MSDANNCLLAYKSAFSAEALRNALLLGMDKGVIKGFLEKKLDKDSVEWKFYDAKKVYFEPAQSPQDTKVQMKHHFSILRHVGRLTGMYPTDAATALTIDDSLDMLESFRGKFKKATSSAQADKLLCETMQHFNTMIQENGVKGCTVGHSMTVLDLELASIVGWCGSQVFVNKGFFDRQAFREQFPQVYELRRTVNEHPVLIAAAKRHQVHYALCKAGHATHGDAHSHNYVQKLKLKR